MDLITPAVSLISAIIGAIIGGRMSQIASLEATEKSHKNNLEIQEKDRRLAVDNILNALYDELNILWERYMWGIGEVLETFHENEPLLFYYPITQEYFTIYNNNAHIIAWINNHELRRAIVLIYTKAKSLIDSYRLNNSYVDRFNNLLDLYRESPTEESSMRLGEHRATMVAYAIKIKSIHNDLKQSREALIKMYNEKGIIQK